MPRPAINRATKTGAVAGTRGPDRTRPGDREPLITTPPAIEREQLSRALPFRHRLGVAIATADVRTSNGAEMSQELKNRTKKFALDVIGLCAGLPPLPETRHSINQLIRSSSSVAANYRSACRGKSKADFIAKLGIVEEEADESGFWLEMLRDVCELLSANSEPRTHHPLSRSRTEIRHSKLDLRTSQELARLLDETDQLVAITVASRKTARASDC